MTNTERAERLLKVVTDLSAIRSRTNDPEILCRSVGILSLVVERKGKRWRIGVVGDVSNDYDDIDLIEADGDGDSYTEALHDALNNYASCILKIAQYRLDWAEEAGE